MTHDMPQGVIVNFDAPAIICPLEKSSLSFKVTVRLDSALLVPQYCWLGLYESIANLPGNQVACLIDSFTTPTTITFNDVVLPNGLYIAVAGLRLTDFCGTIGCYDTTDHRPIVVGGDICQSWKTFGFDYYRQGTLDAFQLGLSHVQHSYDTVHISLDSYNVPDTLQFERIVVADIQKPDELLNYLVDHVDVQLAYERHLFAVRSIVNSAGQRYAIGGITLTPDNGDWVSYVCVTATVTDFWGLDTAQAVSFTTAHELGHLVGNLTDACPWPDSHIVGMCIMEELDVAPGNHIALYCHLTDQYWEFTDTFCDSCVVRLKRAQW